MARHILQGSVFVPVRHCEMQFLTMHCTFSSKQVTQSSESIVFVLMQVFVAGSMPKFVCAQLPTLPATSLEVSEMIAVSAALRQAFMSMPPEPVLVVVLIEEPVDVVVVEEDPVVVVVVVVVAVVVVVVVASAPPVPVVEPEPPAPPVPVVELPPPHAARRAGAKRAAMVSREKFMMRSVLSFARRAGVARRAGRAVVAGAARG
jgi:hypothetical protein